MMISQLFYQVSPEQQAQAQIPGKLYLAGEYAILTPNQPALIMAVNRYITVDVERSTTPQHGTIISNENHWKYQRTSDSQLNWDHLSPAEQDFWKYTRAAIHLIEQLVLEFNIPLMDYQLTIQSDMIDINGQKVGFGSSGAVTLAVILSLLKLYGLKPCSGTILYKLGAIAQTQLNVQGSFGDLAASSYGGIVFYQSLDRLWLEQQLDANHSIGTLLEVEWPGLKIMPVPEPLPVNIYFGWTGKPASTERLVSSLKKQLKQNPAPYQTFVSQAHIIVIKLFHALECKDSDRTIQFINLYHTLLNQLASEYHLNILTESLLHLVQSAQLLNMGGKSSGAGGGDCGIAVEAKHGNTSNNNELFTLWRQGGVTPLSLQIAPKTL
ncbi:phosphomevalonate kinase [Aerococcaceae bacterium DSM 111020]|nr:phosphomevalonate kinase [Aerococcaceae bacterium DSM 111020]